MYNVKGPSKIVAKTTRRGISQNIDNMRDYNRNKSVDNDENEVINGPKPVFQKKLQPSQHREESISPQHEEIIKFIQESWNAVCAESEQGSVESDDSGGPKSELSSVVYYEDEPSPLLQDFKPFDLESWWGKRLYAYITGSSPVTDHINQETVGSIPPWVQKKLLIFSGIEPISRVKATEWDFNPAQNSLWPHPVIAVDADTSLTEYYTKHYTTLLSITPKDTSDLSITSDD